MSIFQVFLHRVQLICTYAEGLRDNFRHRGFKEFGGPNGYLYRIYLREYVVEIKKLEPETGFMGYTPLEKSS